MRGQKNEGRKSSPQTFSDSVGRMLLAPCEKVTRMRQQWIERSILNHFLILIVILILILIPAVQSR